MKRFVAAITIILLLQSTSFAAHIFGGEMVYQYIGAGDLPNSKKYRIILKLFRDDDGGGAQLPTNVFIGVFDYGTKQHYPTTQNYHDVPRTSGPTIVNMNVSPCATGNTSGNYSVAEYSFIIDLPNNSQGYIAAYETCCRRNGLANVDHPGGVGGAGSTYVCKIPGSNQIPISQHNSSPQFITSLDLVCRNTQFSWNFSATDPDGDSLAYAFTAGYNKTTATTAANIPPATPSITLPDYPLLTYINGFTGNIPLGTLASINPQTGIISGIAPELGYYVTCVIVYEYRNGVLIGEHRKDFILRIQDCDIPEATLSPRPTTCDGFSLNFVNETPSPLINSYFWDFGVSTAVNDTSNLAAPSFTFPDTGVYIVKLVTNRGQQCADSTSTVVRIFPGFFPGFIYNGSCFTNPYQFTDTTNTRYGVVDSWRWDFGDGTTLADTSRIQNPQYTYPNPGTRDVRLIVTNSKGCIDTAIVTINVLDKPLITLAFNDTLICVPDAVTLSASGTGTFNWTPLTNISNPNTPNPTVNPTTDTWYVANLTDNGCANKDSVHVRVISGVSLTVMPDTTIC
jgi:PKD repeat protein